MQCRRWRRRWTAPTTPSTAATCSRPAAIRRRAEPGPEQPRRPARRRRRGRRQNQKDKAASYYLRLLELSPNDGAATAGLIGLRQGDISRSEARLKAILATNPEAAPVLFALGNLYAQQGRWPDAQQAYFRAYGAAPTIPTTPTTWPSAWTA
jgi:tetratricopeptide (TPR) repeat protein